MRFFNGTAWTARTRPVIDEGVRRLPTAALRLRAKFLEAQDTRAVRRGDKPYKAAPLVIPAASNAPSLHLRTHQSTSILGMLSSLLIVAGLAAAAVFAWNLWGSDYWNDIQQSQLEQQLAEQEATPGSWGDVPVVIENVPAQPANAPTTPTALPSMPAPAKTSSKPAPKPTAPSKPAPKPSRAPAGSTTQRVTVAPTTLKDGKPVGRIRIPKIGLNKVFVLGTETKQLAMGPGLWKWGVVPGTPGNATISGHRNGHGEPFRHLDKLKDGDRIHIEIPGQPTATFEVRGRTLADPFAVSVTKQTAGVRLTLTTCHPYGSDAERMVIQSELISGKYVNQAVPKAQWKLLR